MNAPEFLTPENGYQQLTIPSPFGDGRLEVDIFARHLDEASEYIIYIDGHEMGDLMFDDGEWHPIRDCMLTAREISILTPIIAQSEIKPAEPKPISEGEQQLRNWLDNQGIEPGNKLMQSMIINSFYAEDTEDHDADNLIELDTEAPEDLELPEDFDYRDYEEDVDWEEKIAYTLANMESFQAYVNENWRI